MSESRTVLRHGLNDHSNAILMSFESNPSDREKSPVTGESEIVEGAWKRFELMN